MPVISRNTMQWTLLSIGLMVLVWIWWPMLSPHPRVLPSKAPVAESQLPTWRQPAAVVHLGLQVASFHKLLYAERLVTRLSLLGYQTWTQKIELPRGVYYRVFVTGFKEEHDPKRLQEYLAEHAALAGQLVRVDDQFPSGVS